MTTKYEDGVYNISNKEYHEAGGISRSKLILLDKSPHHFWYEVFSGLAETKKATPAMILGSAFHTLLLEPSLFSKEYAVSYKIDRRTTKGKEEYKIFMAENEGKIFLSEDEFNKVNKMVCLVKEHEVVTTLLDEAQFEQSIFWTDKETGIQFKTRPDIWSSKVIVDLKTSWDTNNYSFMRSALKYGYYLQAGMAFEACKAIGKPFEMFVVLAVEKEEPYAPSVFMMTDEALQFGIDQFHSYKRKLKECLDNDKWPAYSVQELGIPKYATTNDED